MPLKVLYIAHYFPGFYGYFGGGAEKVLERLLLTLSNLYPKGYLPVLHVLQKKNANNKIKYPFPLIEDPEGKLLLSTIEKNNSPNTILHFSNTYFILGNPNLFSKIVKMWVGPVVQRVTLASRMSIVRKKMGGAFLKYISGVDVFISQSSDMTKELLNLGIEKSKVIKIENGIDCKNKTPLPTAKKAILRKKLIPQATPDSRIFIFSGRITDPVKKVNELIRAWISSGLGKRNNFLILAGEDKKPDWSFVKNYPEKILLGQNIKLTGLLSEEKMDGYYQIADIYVTASEQEGFSNAVIEAMAFGLPIIGRHGVSGHEEQIIDGVTGFLFRSLKDLERKMTQLAQDIKLCRSFGDNARRRVIEVFSVEKMANKYRDLYLNLIR